MQKAILPLPLGDGSVAMNPEGLSCRASSAALHSVFFVSVPQYGGSSHRVPCLPHTGLCSKGEPQATRSTLVN